MKSFVIGLVTAATIVSACGRKRSNDQATLDEPVAVAPTAAPVVAPLPVAVTPVAAPTATFVPLHPAAVPAAATTTTVVPVLAAATTPALAFVAAGIAGGWSNGAVDQTFPDNRSATSCKSYAQINESLKKASFGYYCWYNNVAVTFIHVQSLGDIVSESDGKLVYQQTAGCDTAHNNTQMSTPFTYKAASGGTNKSLMITLPNVTTGQTKLGEWSPSSMGAIASQHVGCIDRKSLAFTADDALRTTFAAMAQ